MSDGPIVICGFPRSGTTLLYLMLRATVRNYQFEDQERPAKINETRNLITKRPLDVFRSLPHPRIILIRDPRAVLTSKHAQYPPGYFIGADTSAVGTPGLIDHYKAIQKLTGHVLKYESLVDDPNGVQWQLQTVFNLGYTGWFSDFHQHKPPPNLTRQLNGLRPVDKGHDWREHLPRIRDQFNRFPELFNMLIDLGYEKDRTWFSRLPA